MNRGQALWLKLGNTHTCLDTVNGLVVSACLFIFLLCLVMAIFLPSEILKIFLSVYTRSMYIKDINSNYLPYIQLHFVNCGRFSMIVKLTFTEVKQ